jgi:hypothetical protein
VFAVMAFRQNFIHHAFPISVVVSVDSILRSDSRSASSGEVAIKPTRKFAASVLEKPPR